jgi:Pro-kumamolisin, activation domain/Bacterial Ig-like domain (group 3)
LNFIGTRGLTRLVVACLFTAPILSLSAQERRIAGPIEASRTIVLKGNRNPRALAANDEGPLDPFTRIPYMRLTLKPTPQQTADLETLLEAQRDPSSSDYHRWLTPEEFGERFGASQNDIGKLRAWLESAGFTVEQTARARNWIAFSGTAGQIERTFRTAIHRYESGGEAHFANAAEPSVPAALAALVGDLKGLDDFHLKPPRVKRITPDYTTSSGAHYLVPDDIAAIYDIAPLYKAGYDGTGQKIAIVGQTDINLADIRGFRSEFGLAAKDPQLVLYGPDPGVSSGDQIESDLDLEWSGAVARNATILFVYSRDVMESVQYAIDENLAPVISMSYGGCEQGVSASNRVVAQQANAEGITWMTSSGDSGAAGCDWGGPSAAQYGPVVTFPADIPEITAVGGTEFSESGSAGWSATNSATFGSATGYIPEKAWNDTALGGGIWASGGGASAVFPKPWWQAGPGVPADNVRDVPDIALTASGDHDGYLVYFSGQLYPVGGTSASSPSFAGIVALVNQYLMANGIQSKSGLGNINPALYNLAQNTTGVIHDITTGDNVVPCVSKSPGCSSGSFGYKAGLGYDQVTGLGTVDAYNLVTKWTSLPAAIGTTLTLTASPASIAQSASTQLTAKVSAVTGSNPPTGSVTFSAGGVSLGSAALIPSGSTATATLTVKGAGLSAGNNVIAASYTGAGTFSNSTGTATVTVTGAPVATKTVVTATPASLPSTATLQLTATVTPASGSAAPTGTVTFLAGTTSLGTATLAASSAASSNATATLSVSAAKLAMGANSITASYAGVTNFSSSVSPAVTVTVTAPLIATTASLAANPASIAQSASTVLTVTVKAASGTTSPTGTVTFATTATAANTLGTATLSGSGGTATATLTVKGASLAAGSNSITATYGGDGKFSGSAAPATVTVTGAVAITTTTVAANPTTIAQNSTTTITATVKAATGTALPTGTVNFALGNTSLGSGQLTAGAGAATATLSLAGSKLSLGNNTITASYAGATGFAASSGTVVVVATSPQIATTTTLAASPASIAQTATTQLTATVKPASGSTAPTGSVTFTAGNVSLGSATLTASGSTATATLTVKASSLTPGSNTIAASYPGSNTFAASSGSATVTVASGASNVVATATKTTDSQPGFAVKVQLQETAGVATKLTGFTINGTNFTPAIAAFFGATQIAANATLSSIMNVQWTPLPSTLAFVFNGVDASGRQWSQTVSLTTK